ncbi:hypothetical protein HO133_008965 [Letharia lupina]|uniref:Uncharacterized protein n=1 Tax=Letharia lupina TaxID=560253 RepID=A0A8H6FF68_9LECA|nr:uncharacterized protein HO133_008965 [Letharia lupina]KAF6226100.1 hypothetical protein HO133_008965 [Letharia lupina]
MSRDIFTDFVGSPPSRVSYGFVEGFPSRAQNEGSTRLVPRDPDMQRLVDAMNAERDAERARKEVEMNTPENRQKAAEAEMAERERKRINFHFGRAMPMFINEGWKHIGGDLADEEIRVYTTDYERRRFWGIKPAGMWMYDFWEQNDPEVSRYDDFIAITWANPLIPPPVTTYDENNSDVWAGPGPNPELTPPEPPVAKALPPAEAATKPRRRQQTPDVNPSRRVKKSTTVPPKVNKSTRKSLADKVHARQPGFGDQVREVGVTARASGRPTRNEAAVTASGAQQETAREDRHSAHSRRPRGRPAAKANPAAKDETSLASKRPRGRPAANTKPATKDEDELPSKRPRGRPPAKAKPAKKSPEQKKTPAVKGNARVTKASQRERRPSARSTHKMRTRGEGPAELLQLA